MSKEYLESNCALIYLGLGLIGFLVFFCDFRVNLRIYCFVVLCYIYYIYIYIYVVKSIVFITLILLFSFLLKEYAQCYLKLVWGVWMMRFLKKHRSLSSLLGKCSGFLPSWSCFPNLSGPTCLFGSILWLFGTICSKLVSLFLLLLCFKNIYK